MAVALVSRWARRYVLGAVASLAAAHVAVLVDASTRTTVGLALDGFVLLVEFGKACSLVPSYFDRDLAAPRAMVVQFPLAVLGVVGMALAPVAGVPRVVGTIGALAWVAGVVVLVAAIAWTIRSNPTGREAATGDGCPPREPRPCGERVRPRRPLVPSRRSVRDARLVGRHAGRRHRGRARVRRVSAARQHPLGAGTATLLVVALGARLWPRFIVVDPRGLFVLVLATGALGPVVLAATIPVGEFLVAAGQSSVTVSKRRTA